MHQILHLMNGKSGHGIRKSWSEFLSPRIGVIWDQIYRWNLQIELLSPIAYDILIIRYYIIVIHVERPTCKISKWPPVSEGREYLARTIQGTVLSSSSAADDDITIWRRFLALYPNLILHLRMDIGGWTFLARWPTQCVRILTFLELPSLAIVCRWSW